ncbi:MAG TPA: serine/threonine-protein kinase, partial [Kofleriaceae bacterium]
MPCLDEPTVVRFVAGQLADPETVDEHLADCQSCRDLVVWAAKTTLAIGSVADEPAVIEEDRYKIIELIGTGGQGLVYAATDTVLARTVALKVLRQRDDQILTEARLVARLNHPNIVAVYDAGTTRDGAIYLAMERVAETLPAWRVGKSQREILTACIDAGKGLAAAHDAGIIHRDIKPSNILVGDGRARVTDFGLAREADAAHGLAGTLAYMAPEQRAGVATAASDQYGLAVAIWESLTGELPAQADRPMPRHVAKALRRGLAVEPADRFPNVAALVGALAADPAARRSRWLVIGATALAAGAAVFAFSGSRAPSCKLDDSLHGVWDDDARARVATGFAAVHEPYAARAAASARTSLDRYAQALIDAKTRVCELHESEALFSLRTQCLDERKAALAAAVRTLSTPDAEIARHAQEIVDGLPALAPCDDTAWLTQRVRPPTNPAVKAKVTAIETTLADSATAMHAGKIKAAIALAQRAETESAAIDHAPTRARVFLALGEAHAHLPDNAAAEAALEQAAQWAQRGRDDRAAAEAFIELVKVVGYGFGRYDEALRQAAFADATLARLGDDPGLRATLDYHVCAVDDQLARFADAKKRCAAALSARVDAFGANDVSTADILILQARIAMNQASYPDGEKLAQRALEIREQALGPDHPILVEALFALGQVEVRLGKLAEAEAHYERAMKLAVPTFGEDSSVAGSLWAERSVIASMRGDLPT